MESDEKVVVVGRPNLASTWLDDLHLEGLPEGSVVVWDSVSAFGNSIMSFETVVPKTDEEMEDIRIQEEERNRKNLHRMLSKPRRKR